MLKYMYVMPLPYDTFCVSFVRSAICNVMVCMLHMHVHMLG